MGAPLLDDSQWVLFLKSGHAELARPRAHALNKKKRVIKKAKAEGIYTYRKSPTLTKI
jgi:hypothetical protein